MVKEWNLQLRTSQGQEFKWKAWRWCTSLKKWMWRKKKLNWAKFAKKRFKKKILKGGSSICNKNNCPIPCAFWQDSKKAKRQVFQKRVDNALSNLVWPQLAPLWAGGWTTRPFPPEVPQFCDTVPVVVGSPPHPWPGRRLRAPSDVSCNGALWLKMVDKNTRDSFEEQNEYFK